MKLSVITPTFNEAGNISSLILKLSEILRDCDFEIIVADDNSPDGTWALVEEIGRKDPRVKVLRRMSNRGLSASVIDGFSAAQGDAIACIDADLQHDMTILPAMLQKLVEGSDLVIGSRYIPGGSTGHWSPIRRLESWIATKLAQWVSGVRICDPMSGYFMMQRSDFLRVRDALDVQGFKILLEIAAHQKPVKVSEVPFTFGVRVAGESKLTGKVVYQYLVQLWKLSPMGKTASPEFAKFAAVGASGVLVNLMAMALLLSFTPIRDWRASGLATLLATFSNYALNNFWTFHRRAHRGGKFVGRYAFYLAGSAIALGATTLTFSALSRLLSWTLKGAMPSLKTPLLLACQLVAILAGALLNYKASRTLTWPSADCLTGDIPQVQVSTNIHNEIRRENHEMDLTLVHSEYHGTVLASERQK